VLILLLAAACVQCVAQCADTGHGVPPCHRQQQQQSQNPTLCQIPVVAAKDAPAQLPVEIDIGPAMVLAKIHDTVVTEVSHTHSLPPLLSPVLRI
jgi:hypothetical protein